MGAPRLTVPRPAGSPLLRGEEASSCWTYDPRRTRRAAARGAAGSCPAVGGGAGGGRGACRARQRNADRPARLVGAAVAATPRPGARSPTGASRRAPASERFLVDVGDGEAIVEIEAKQNWDRHGWVIDGDFQSTNGTSSVADPTDSDLPARLRVAVDYCADGTVTTTTAEEGGRILAVSFDMGSLYVCDTTLEHTPDNDAAFRQDDTPADFHGDVRQLRVAPPRSPPPRRPAPPASSTASAATSTGITSCSSWPSATASRPTTSRCASAGSVPPTTTPERPRGRPRPGHRANTTPTTPTSAYEALSVQYLAGDGEAVVDSCYLGPGDRDLDDLGVAAGGCGG